MKRAIPPQAEQAVNKYREFHRLEPMRIGEFDDLHIPKRMYRAGAAKWVTYQSGKVDPETLRRPSKPLNYIHEHDAGVGLYLAARRHATGHAVDVPHTFREVSALVRLGACLGFCFEGPAGKHEAKGTRPLPDLYATPDGRCLLVIQSKRQVLAMMWGGGLGVYARGIDG